MIVERWTQSNKCAEKRSDVVEEEDDFFGRTALSYKGAGAILEACETQPDYVVGGLAIYAYNLIE